MMKIAAAAAGLPAVLLAAPAAAGPLPCQVDPASCQLPDQAGHGMGNSIGATSDANPVADFAAFDNLTAAATGSISTVCWWGVYLDFAAQADCGPGGVPDSFQVTYFLNDAGVLPRPGALKAGPFDVTPTLTKAASGAIVPSGFGDLAEYEFSATHPAVPVTAGECVWIQIRNDTSGSDPTCIWVWTAAPSAAEGGAGDGLFYQNGQDYDFDLAFCVDVPLADPATCTLVVNPGCADAVNECNLESSAPGCVDGVCCTLVCEQLPFCCIVAWDAGCVQVASQICTECGEPASGNCFSANFTPFCSDQCGPLPCPGCCQTVCSVDPACCTDGIGWDGFCALEAQQLCTCSPGDEPPNDECADALPIALGDTVIDNRCGVAGPPSHADCTDGFVFGLGVDIWYQYTAGFTGPLLVSTCDQVTWDTQLAVYSGCDCGQLSDPPLACNNDGPACGTGSSELVVEVVQGQCYLVRVGGSFTDPTGSGVLTLSQNVPPTCDISASIPPEAVAEGEPCGDNTNGGCDNVDPDPPAFTRIQLGETVHGTAWALTQRRDTDWYELTIARETNVTMTVEAEFPFVAGFAETDPAGSGDCADATGFVTPGVSGPTCESAVLSATLGPGTWWPFIAPSIGDGLACPSGGAAGGLLAGNDYVLSVVAVSGCPSDCGDFNGTVDTVDFLALLAQWGAAGDACDFGLGGPGVGVEEFLQLLADWGPCP